MIRRLIPVLVLTAVALVACGPLFAQGRDFGRTTIRVPDPVTAGEFTGTWTFENRLRQMALWLREGEAGLEIRVKHLMLTDAEAFFTDWDGTASYSFGRTDGEARIVIEESDADSAVGSWFWRSDDGVTVTETGRFTLFRAEDGRYVVMRFDELEIRRESAGGTEVHNPPRVWSLRKASRRLVGWDEIAF